jgi:hypothetical protein
MQSLGFVLVYVSPSRRPKSRDKLPCPGLLAHRVTVTLFLEPVKHKMTIHVESALETGKLRETQMA